MADWHALLGTTQEALSSLSTSLAELEQLRSEAVAQIAGLGEKRGLSVNLAAAEALFQRPYTIVPTGDPNESLIVQSLVVADLPSIGWILSEDAAFRVSRVSRTMGLLGTLPDWIRTEAGWAPPEHAATVDPLTGQVDVHRGDRDSFHSRYGRWLGKPTAGGFALKSSAGFIGLVTQLLKDGISPHVARTVDAKDWDKNARCDIELRDYQKTSHETFAQYGGVSMIAPTGAGKMFSMLYLAAHLCTKRPGIICAPSAILVEDWQREAKLHAPDARLKIMTYAMAAAHLKELQKEDLIFTGFDELHRLPANEWSRLAFVRNRRDIYTAGATASPYREDDRTALIIALCGPPAAVPWAPLIERGILNRPRSEVRIVKSEDAKFAELSALLRSHPNERIFIYCETLEIGKDLSRRLGIPFVSGEIKSNRRALVESSKHCILSVVGELGISFKDLTFVVEYDVQRTGRSRTSGLQRHGRLMHSLLKRTTYLVLFTADEYHKFGDRLNGIRQELGDVAVVDRTGEAGKAMAKKASAPKRSAVAVKPGDEVGALLAIPAVRKLIDEANAKVWAGRDYMSKFIRLCWDAPVSIEELRAGKGLAGRALSAYRAAAREGTRTGLLTKIGDDRFLADKGKFKTLEKLSARYGK